MENNEKRSFGEFITQRRKALGMTQREFADKLFVTDSAVSKWERSSWKRLLKNSAAAPERLNAANCAASPRHLSSPDMRYTARAPTP